MIRVCLLCAIWESGGIEAFLHNIVSHMDRSGLEIDLVAERMGKSIFTRRLQALGVRFYELSGSTRRFSENKRLFRKLLTERRYDVIHLNAYQGLSLAYFRLAREMCVPVRIAHSHNTLLRKSLTKPLKQLIHSWAKTRYTGEATALWACSKHAAEFLFPKRFISRYGYTFIPNGIDMQRFRFNSEVRQKLRGELDLGSKFVIGNVGRLCYQKNQDFLLDVFYEVVKQRPDSVLLLVGEGPDRSALEEKARRLGLAGQIVFFGTTDQVEQLYWAMDVYVMPSRFEGLPVTGIEAQAAGLPCLFSRKITTECVISREAAFLPIEVGPTRWAETLLTMRRSDTAIDTEMSDRFEIRSVAEKIRLEWTKQKHENI